MEPEAYTIEEFCRAYRISRAHYFNMRNVGETPRVMQVGKRILISREAAADWVKEREKAAKKALPPSERKAYREYKGPPG